MGRKNPRRKPSKPTLSDLASATDEYYFYDRRTGEHIGTLYSDEPVKESRARNLMIGKLLSEGWSFAEADDEIMDARMEHFETHNARRRNPDNWRPIGTSGAYPRWLRELEDRSGAYAIRKAETGEVLYVGESHSDQLYKTITRHFQRWDGYTAGTTYRRGDVELAVATTTKDHAGRKQLDWIASLEPRDNKYGHDADEDIDPSEFMDGVVDAVEEAPRRRNPSHSIPKRTAQLGTVLDLVVERDGSREIFRREVRGALLLAPEDAMDRSPGGGRLYLVRGKLEKKRPIEGGDAPRAQRTFERWHRSHGPDAIGDLDVPDAIDVPVGRAVRIGYRSDKFGGKKADYEHDFEDPQPRVYSTGGASPRALVIVGGGFTISGRGIVG